MSADDPELRRAISAKAANIRVLDRSAAERRAMTETARAELQRRLEVEVDPDGTLDPAERGRRAKCLRRIRLAEMAIRSAQVRRAQCASAELDVLIAAGGEVA